MLRILGVLQRFDMLPPLCILHHDGAYAFTYMLAGIRAAFQALEDITPVDGQQHSNKQKGICRHLIPEI